MGRLVNRGSPIILKYLGYSCLILLTTKRYTASQVIKDITARLSRIIAAANKKGRMTEAYHKWSAS
jgi:hypothetical protein